MFDWINALDVAVNRFYERTNGRLVKEIMLEKWRRSSHGAKARHIVRYQQPWGRFHQKRISLNVRPVGRRTRANGWSLQACTQYLVTCAKLFGRFTPVCVRRISQTVLLRGGTRTGEDTAAARQGEKLVGARESAPRDIRRAAACGGDCTPSRMACLPATPAARSTLLEGDPGGALTSTASDTSQEVGK